MKTLATLFTACLLISCSTDTTEDTPRLSFELNDGERFASAEVRAANTSTNYIGSFIWEITSNFESFNTLTRDLTFIPRYSGQYNITLKNADESLEFEKSLFIARPNSKRIRSISLQNIPQDYQGIYFRSVKYTINDDFETIYSSPLISNITEQNPSVAVWEIPDRSGAFEIVDPSAVGSEGFASYNLEFYDDQDRLITRLEPIFNTYWFDCSYEAGEILLNTAQNCVDCASFVTRVTIQYEN